MKARSFLTRKLNLLLVLLILVVWSGRIASPAGGLAVAPAQPPEPTLPAATLAPTAVVAAPTATPAPPQEPTAATAPADIPKVEWFALRPEVASHWALALDPRNDTMFTLSPRNPAEFDGAGKRSASWRCSSSSRPRSTRR